MAWNTQTDTQLAVLIGTLIDVERPGAGIVVGVRGNGARRGAVA